MEGCGGGSKMLADGNITWRGGGEKHWAKGDITWRG